MTSAEVLAEAFGRVREVVHSAVHGLSVDQLTTRPAEGANTIAWLVWHLTRIQDDHLAGASGTAQAWTADGWADRFGLPFAEDATGYGQTADEVAEVRASADLLTAYYDAVHTRTVEYVKSLADAGLDRIVDEHWDPPVTLGVRLVSVLSDDLQHAGQASYLRGLLT